MKRRQRNASLVYSTDHGRVCPGCGQPASKCRCTGQPAQKPEAPKGDGVVRVGRQTRGRKGKGVTVVTGLPLGTGELQELAKRLKARCGAGGTVKDGVIEIQGEHRDAVVGALEAEGFAARRGRRISGRPRPPSDSGWLVSRGRKTNQGEPEPGMSTSTARMRPSPGKRSCPKTFDSHRKSVLISGPPSAQA